jgi:hypothetical protein
MNTTNLIGWKICKLVQNQPLGELNLRTRNRLSFEPAAGGPKLTFDDLAYRGTLL